MKLTNSAHVVLGAGVHMTRAHLQYLTPPSVSRLHVFDPGTDIEKLSALKVPTKVHPTEDAAIIADNTAHIVWIGSPDQFHLEQLTKAVRAKKHVFVEKPLITKLADLPALKTILDEAAQNNLIVLSCHPRRFDPPYGWLKNNISQLTTRFGAVLNFAFDFTYHAPVSSWKLDRSLLLDHVNHEVDLLNFILGAAPLDAQKVLDSHDRYLVTGKRKDDVAFTLSGTRRLDAHRYDELVRIRFARGEVTLFANEGRLEIYDHEKREHNIESVPAVDYPTRDKAVTANFLAAVQGAEGPYLTKDELIFNAQFGVTLADKGLFTS